MAFPRGALLPSVVSLPAEIVGNTLMSSRFLGIDSGIGVI